MVSLVACLLSLFESLGFLPTGFIISFQLERGGFSWVSLYLLPTWLTDLFLYFTF